MSGALEEHVTSYKKHARITAEDTRLSNGSIISKKEKKKEKNIYIHIFWVFL